VANKFLHKSRIEKKKLATIYELRIRRRRGVEHNINILQKSVQFTHIYSLEWLCNVSYIIRNTCWNNNIYTSDIFISLSVCIELTLYPLLPHPTPYHSFYAVLLSTKYEKAFLYELIKFHQIIKKYEFYCSLYENMIILLRC